MGVLDHVTKNAILCHVGSQHYDVVEEEKNPAHIWHERWQTAKHIKVPEAKRGSSKGNNLRLGMVAKSAVD